MSWPKLLTLTPKAMTELREMAEASADLEDGDGFWKELALLLNAYDARDREIARLRGIIETAGITP